MRLLTPPAIWIMSPMYLGRPRWMYAWRIVLVWEEKTAVWCLDVLVGESRQWKEEHFVIQSLWQDDNSMPLRLCKMSSHMPKSRRVLTKEFFMSIIHRITIQRSIGYNPGFVLSCSKPQFPRKDDIFYGDCVFTKSWSNVFWLWGIDKKFFCIHNTSYHDIDYGFCQMRRKDRKWRVDMRVGSSIVYLL